MQNWWTRERVLSFWRSRIDQENNIEASIEASIQYQSRSFFLTIAGKSAKKQEALFNFFISKNSTSQIYKEIVMPEEKSDSLSQLGFVVMVENLEDRKEPLNWARSYIAGHPDGCVTQISGYDWVGLRRNIQELVDFGCLQIILLAKHIPMDLAKIQTIEEMRQIFPNLGLVTEQVLQ